MKIMRPYQKEGSTLQDKDLPRNRIEILNIEELWGCKITPHFFDTSVNDSKLTIHRLLPFLPIKAENNVKVLYLEKDRHNFRYGDIIAQPDGVFSISNYFVSLQYQSLSDSRRQLHDKFKWRTQIRLRDILQCVIGGLQVSGVNQAPCVSILRYVNSLYILYPSKELCSLILEQAPKAKVFKNEGHYIRSSLLAEVIENDVKNMYSSRKESISGQQQHNNMLRR